MTTASIGEHGIIGNMRSAALVNVFGAIDFFCFPEFDSPSSLHCLIQSAHAAFPYDRLVSLGKEDRFIFRRRTCSPLDSYRRIPSSSCAIGCR